jgi:hypothetical protein
LRTNAYARVAAAPIVVCFLAQSALCFGSVDCLAAASLELSLYSVTASAFLLAREQSVRGIIRAGGALAGAQIIVPFGGLFTAALLPVFIGLPRPGEWRKSLGVLILLLFMPGLAAIVLAKTEFQLVTAPARTAPHHFAIACVLFPMLLALTTAGFRRSRWIHLIPLLTGTALLVAIAVGGTANALQSPRALASATASILLVAISEWPMAEHRARNAIALSAGVAGAFWTALAAALL